LQDVQTFDALVLQKESGSRCEIYWFLRSAMPEPASLWQVQQAFLGMVHSDKGLMVTDPFGTILSVNAEYCRISGYSEAELLAQNPRIMSSGRHDTAFYQDLWMDLLDKGCWSGTLFNRRKNGQIFLEWQAIKMIEDLKGQVVSYISAIYDLSQEDGVRQQLQKLASHDPLTGLPNRRLLVETFAQQLVQADHDHTELAVVYIDLDRFKPINDEWGHAVGDLVLQEVAMRLKDCMGPSDTLARVGGDEFVVVLAHPDRVRRAQGVALEWAQAIQQPIQVNRQALTVGASMGCARYPADGSDMVGLLERADAAMFGAKRAGLNFAHYDASSDRHARPDLERDLWTAQERGELLLQFQPQLRAPAGATIRGCEALIRWVHPSLGEIPATTFVPMAERNGAIVPIGKWVLAQACSQLQEWRALGLLDLSMSVNVSLRQIRDAGFAAHVRLLLEENNLPPSCLELEFSETETLLFRESDTEHISVLSALGVRISIDDFGVSFSSLSRLRSLSISSLKINSQFVRDLTSSEDARGISNCMLAIGKAMGIEVIAQGVESAEQARILEEQGCQVMQGHFAGHPMTADALLQRLRQQGGQPGPESPTQAMPL
jgi:diguanylate cyclase (GGDEF)-like protein/PAS domain S-box-containing protein